MEKTTKKGIISKIFGNLNKKETTNISAKNKANMKSSIKKKKNKKTSKKRTTKKIFSYASKKKLNKKTKKSVVKKRKISRKNIKLVKKENENSVSDKIIERLEKLKRENNSDMSKNDIVTDYDTILSFVKQKGKTTDKEVSKEFNIKKNVVREIANVLSEEKLLIVDYPVVGKMRLIDPDLKNKKVKK